MGGRGLGPEVTERIVAQAKCFGAAVAGVADVRSLTMSPSHTIYPKIGLDLSTNGAGNRGDSEFPAMSWPDDAVSVVVIGVEHPESKPELDWWDGKGTSGNRLLIQINNQLSAWIESTLGIPTSKLPYFVEKGGIFLKDAAVHAGLGCIGRNNLVITPEYGPRVRFRAMLLNREVAPSRRPAFNPCATCGGPCRLACPVEAFTDPVYTAEAIGQATLPGTDGRYDRVSCNGKMEADMDDAAKTMAADGARQEEFRRLIGECEKQHQRQPAVQQTFTYCVKYCRQCELSCPVGRMAPGIRD